MKCKDGQHSQDSFYFENIKKKTIQETNKNTRKLYSYTFTQNSENKMKKKNYN